MSCVLALPNGFVPGYAEVREAPDGCAAFQLDVSGRLAAVRPDPGIGTRVDLSRARLAVAGADGPVRAAVRTSAVRSTAEGGYLGIDGEAYVLEVDAAVAGAVWERTGLHGEAGIVPDLWVTGADRAWGLPGTTPDLGSALGWMERGDLGAQGGVVVPGGYAALDVALTAGEGYAVRERNEGKDLAVVVTGAPFAGTDQPHALVLTGYARDGSRGIGFVRDSRLGFRVSGEVAGDGGDIGYGAEVLAAWGVAADAQRTPVGGSAWLRGSPVDPAYGAVRADVWTEGGATAQRLVVTGGVRVAADDPAGTRLLLLAGVARTRTSPALAPIAGADLFDVGTTWFLQADAVVRTDTE